MVKFYPSYGMAAGNSKRKKLQRQPRETLIEGFDRVTTRLKELGLIAPTQYVECTYGCSGCGKRDQPVQVMARDRDESLLDFVERVRVAVYIDHMNNSKGCKHRVADLKIPMLGTDLGRPVR